MPKFVLCSVYLPEMSKQTASINTRSVKTQLHNFHCGVMWAENDKALYLFKRQ